MRQAPYLQNEPASMDALSTQREHPAIAKARVTSARHSLQYCAPLAAGWELKPPSLLALGLRRGFRATPRLPDAILAAAKQVLSWTIYKTGPSTGLLAWEGGF